MARPRFGPRWTFKVRPGACGRVHRSRASPRPRWELTALITRRRQARLFVSDHGTEFTSNAMLAWSEETRRALALHRPGQSRWAENGICEAFNSKMRDELLNETLFLPASIMPESRRRWCRRLQCGPPHSAPRLPDPRLSPAQPPQWRIRLPRTDAFRRSLIAPLRAAGNCHRAGSPFHMDECRGSEQAQLIDK